MIEDYLKKIALMSSGENRRFYEWIIKEGILFTSLDINESTSISKEIETEQRYCFRNSLIASVRYEIDYFEGFYLVEGLFPMDHAWNMKEGKVVDVTAILLEGEVKEWFGVCIPVEFVIKKQYNTIREYYLKEKR